MHLSHSRGWRAHRSAGLRLPGLSLRLALLFSIMLVARLTPSEPQVGAGSQSCKPSPPYAVELIAAGDTQWTLILSNSASAQELAVWMWSEVDAAGTAVERQMVWSGSLDAAALQRISVQYAPPANAQRVWASLESREQSRDLQAAAMRGYAVAAGPAAKPARRPNHVITEDPTTGAQVEQYVGQGGLQ